MASRFLKKHPIPNGFRQIIFDLTKEILRAQPNDIIEFSAIYFESLQNGQPFQYENKNRVNTKSSNRTEKAVANDFVDNMYESAINQSDMDAQDEENQICVGNLLLSIIQAEIQGLPEGTETHCVVFPTNDTSKLIQTQVVKDHKNPVYNHDDKIELNLVGKEIMDTSLIIQIYNSETNDLICETFYEIQDKLLNPSQWTQEQLKLELNDQDVGTIDLEICWENNDQLYDEDEDAPQDNQQEYDEEL